MAVGIQNYPNVTTPDSDYPDGSSKDRTPGNFDGTPMNVLTMGDYQQWFAKILREAGITPNGFPDGPYEEFQYFEAFLKTAKRYQSIVQQVASFTTTIDNINNLTVLLPVVPITATLNHTGFIEDGDVFEAVNAGIAPVTVSVFAGQFSDGGTTRVVLPGQSIKCVKYFDVLVPTTIWFIVKAPLQVVEQTLQVGNWDMNSTVSVAVAHGSTAPSKITKISCSIINDGNSVFYELTSGDPTVGNTPQGTISWDNSFITLSRMPGGLFDSVDYNNPSFNRGFLTITYIP